MDALADDSSEEKESEVVGAPLIRPVDDEPSADEEKTSEVEDCAQDEGLRAAAVAAAKFDEEVENDGISKCGKVIGDEEVEACINYFKLCHEQTEHNFTI